MVITRKHTTYIFPIDESRKFFDDKILAKGIKGGAVFEVREDTTNDMITRYITFDMDSEISRSLVDGWATDEIATQEKPSRGRFPAYFLNIDTED